MSALLSQLEGRERRAECLRNDAALNGEPAFTCWGLRSFCAEVGHKCRAAGKCVFTPPSTAARAFFAECEAEARDVMRGKP